MLQLLIEVPRSSTDGLLPKAMHPALPSYVILAVTRYSESPVGPFNLAMLRLGSRAGAHPRGFLLGAVASTEAAAHGAARALGPSGRGGRGEVRAPARPRHGHGEEGRQDHPRLRADRPAAGRRHRRAVHQLGDGGERAARRHDAADADPGRSEVHLLQGRARQAAGRRVRRRGVERARRSRSPIRSSAPAAPSTPTCRASAS